MTNQDSDDFEIKLATTSEQILNLRGLWNDTNTEGDLDPDFYSWIITSRSEIISPYVLALIRKGRPTALLVGRLENSDVNLKLGYSSVGKLKMRQLVFARRSFLGERNSQNAGILFEQVLLALKTGIAERALFARLDLGCDLHKLCRTKTGILCRDISDRYFDRWTASLPKNLDEFLQRVSSKHRKQLRRYMRHIEEKYPGRITYAIFDKKDQVEGLCATAEKVARKTYQRGLGIGFLNSDVDRQFLALSAERSWLKAYAVLLDGEPLAYWTGRLYKGTMISDWTGYDPDFKDDELGTVIFLKMIEDLCNLGATTFDFGSGEGFYKKRFGDNNSREIELSIYAPSFKGIMANLAINLLKMLNDSIKSVATKLNLVDRVKKYWRKRLV